MATPEYEDNYARVQAAGGDPYLILGVKSTADDDQIKTRYRRLAMIFHPDRVKSMSKGQPSSVSHDLQERSNDAFRLVGLACALLLDPKKRAEYDWKARNAKDGTIKAGRDNLGGVKVQQDPEDFYNGIFGKHAKNADGAESFANWLDLAVNGVGESALGAVIHGNPDLANQDPNDTDDAVAKKLAKMGLADHTKTLSIPGAPDAKRHFKSSRSRTTHTNRLGDTTTQRTGNSVATITDENNDNETNRKNGEDQKKSSIVVTTTYKVIAYVPKAGQKRDPNAPLPGGIDHMPSQDPRFVKQIEGDDGPKYITAGGDGVSMATKRKDSHSMAASRMSGRSKATGSTGRSNSYDDGQTLASMRTRGSAAPSAAYSRDDSQSMRTTRTSQSSKSNTTSRGGDADSMASRGTTRTGGTARDDSTMRSSKTGRSSSGTMRTANQSRWADAPPMPDDAATVYTRGSKAPSAAYSRGMDDSASRMTGRSGSMAPSMMTSKTGKTGSMAPSAAYSRGADDSATMQSSKTGRSGMTRQTNGTYEPSMAAPSMASSQYTGRTARTSSSRL